MNGIYLKLGKRNPANYTEAQAHDTITRYCFDTIPLHLHPPRSNVGDPLADGERYGWAYQTYDCVSPEPGSYRSRGHHGHHGHQQPHRRCRHTGLDRRDRTP